MKAYKATLVSSVNPLDGVGNTRVFALEPPDDAGWVLHDVVALPPRHAAMVVNVMLVWSKDEGV